MSYLSKRLYNILKVFTFLFMTALIASCGGGSSSSGSSGSTPATLGTLSNGATVTISSGTVPVTTSGSSSATIAVNGGTTADPYLITFESSMVQGTLITQSGAAAAANDANGIVLTTNPEPCLVASGSTTYPNSCVVTITVSANTPAGTYNITPVATDQAGAAVVLSPFTVVVNGSSDSSAKAITSFSLKSIDGTVSTGIISGQTIAVTVPNGTDVTHLVATYVTTGASVSVNGVTQVDGTTVNDFTKPVAYVVTAADGSTATNMVTVTVAPSNTKAITSYSILGNAGVITGTNIVVTVPYGTSLESLVATFTTTGSSVAVNGTVQVSGVTPNNFTVQPVTYVVTAADSSTQNYLVTVNVAANTDNLITAYSIQGQQGIINQVDGTILVKLPFGTQLQAQIASFTTGAANVTVNGKNQFSGVTPNNFESPVPYVVTAASGATRNYTVNVVIEPNTAANMIGYGIDGQVGVITPGNPNTIAVTVPYGTPTESLVATFLTSLGATASVAGVDQTSGSSANDFTNPVTYTVTAADHVTTQEYVVTVTVAPNTDATITAYSIIDPATNLPVQGTISGQNISVTMPFGTSESALVANFTTAATSVTVDGNPQTSGVTPNDFSGFVPLVYVATAEDGHTTKRYLVNVSVARSPEKAITSYCFGSVCGDITGTDIVVTMPFGTDTTDLVATFTTTGVLVTVPGTIAGESANIPQISGFSANDFSNPPVVYTVTAADKTQQQYNVYVVVAQNDSKEITSYTLAGVPGVITGESIAVSLPSGTEVTALVADFTTTGESVTVGNPPVTQTSGQTSNDFTSPVVYTVYAADGTSKDYTVTVSVAPLSEASISSYSLAGSTGVITQSTGGGGTIAVTVPYGTSPNFLIATFTYNGKSITVPTTIFGQTVNLPQISGVTPNNFSTPVTYTVTSADGLVTSQYTVTVTVGPQPGDLITSYSLRGSTGVKADGVINDAAGTINVVLPWSTSTDLVGATYTTTGVRVTVPYTFTVHGHTITVNVPQHGSFGLHNFNNPVVYTVTGADGSQKQYTVTVSVIPNAITSFYLLNLGESGGLGGYNGVITQNTDGSGGTIAVSVPYGSGNIFTSLWNSTLLNPVPPLSPIIFAGKGILPQIPLVSKNDYSQPVDFKAFALPNNNAHYLVTVTQESPAATMITSYSMTTYNVLGESTGVYTGIINQQSVPGTIKVAIPGFVNVSKVIANFTTGSSSSTVYAPGGRFGLPTVQTSGVGPAQNFESGAVVTYTVTNGVMIPKLYNVSVVNLDNE